MSTGALKSRGVNRESRVTPAQLQWVRQLAVIGGTPLQSLEDTDEAVAGPQSETGDSTIQRFNDSRTKAFVPGLQDIPGLIKTLLSDLSCKCRIINRTDRVLRLDPKSIKIESGKFKTDPPATIQPNREGKFLAVNKFPNTAGVEGELVYRIDDKNTGWRIKWDNPRVGSNSSETGVKGPNEGLFEADNDNAQGPEAEFEYVLQLVGAPNPQPGPAPGPDLAASCAITVTNKTESVLTLAGQGHERGDFMTFPATSLQPGASTSFVSIETPNSPDEGCKGFLSWEVGSPASAVWRIEWENAEKAKNTAKATITPQTGGFRSLEQIGQGDENVPVVFTISGATGPTPPPEPKPEPKPEPEPDFVPPVEGKQVTLRKGDKSKDGWVEYAQRLLNAHLGTNLELDGNFGQATLNAVLRFQKEKKLQVDGTIGNQTWAALRQDTPAPPSTDGREPHSFVEEGAEARWAVESEDNNRYLSASDEFQLAVNSVGDAPIDNVEATLRITPPGAKSKVVKIKIGPPHKATSTGAGHFHLVKIQKFKKTFPPADPKAKMKDYLIEAFLPQDLGGDFYKANLREE
jgi:peptidoglycan hydrolase-like protein with peptidoglycan-binding domain